MARPQLRLSNISWRELAVVALPAIAIVAGVFWLTARFIKPAPPDTFVMAAGAAGGAYAAYAERYRAILARDGVKIDLRATAGSEENLARLRDDKDPIQAGFVQGGSTFDGKAEGAATPAPAALVSLAGIGVEPLWVFHRADQPSDRLRQLAGRRVAIGPPGSGTRKLALELLEASGVDARNATLVEQGGDAAADALVARRIDAMFVSAAATAPIVDKLLRAPGVRAMHLVQAEGYARRYPFLTKLTLPRGAIDFGADIPPRDTDMVGTVINLVAREELHPALMYLLLEAAREAHAGHGMFHREGDFPALKSLDFPVASESERYFKTGKPFFQRYLPYWLANLVERMLVLLIPIFAVVVPIVKFAPEVYMWRIRRRIARWYRQLRELEFRIGDKPSADHVDVLAAELDRLESAINRARLPGSHSDSLYSLRGAIDLVRERLGRPTSKAIPPLRA